MLESVVDGGHLSEHPEVFFSKARRSASEKGIHADPRKLTRIFIVETGVKGETETQTKENMSQVRNPETRECWQIITI